MGKSCGGVRCSEPGWAQERKEKCFLNGDSEGAFGSESVITRIKWGKAVAGSGVRKGARKERKVFFNRDSEGAFGNESTIRGGSFWTRIRWGKAMAGSGVRSQDGRKKGKKSVFLIGIQRGRLAATVRAGKARFGLELAGEKLWRGQVFGSKQGARKKRKVFF